MTRELCHHRSRRVTARLRRLAIRFQFPDLNRRIDATLARGNVTAASRVRDGCHCLPGGVEQEGLREPFRVEQNNGAAERVRRGYWVR